MAKPIFVLNGPNLNLLGTREPEIYGTQTLADVQKLCEVRAADKGLKVDFRQSNDEAQLVDWIQEARTKACGIIINAAAYTHTSIAVLDALQAVECPVIEVHFTNIFRRDDFRKHSYVSLGATGVICGLGADGYGFAVDAISGIVSNSAG